MQAKSESDFIRYSIRNIPMELNKHNTLRKKERTMKVIEELKKKEEFFEELTQEIHNNFTKEDIHFFFTLECPLPTQQPLKEPALTETTNVPHRSSSTPSEDNFDIMMHIPREEELPSSLNLNIYHNLVKNKMAGQQGSKSRDCGKGRIKNRDSLKGSITPN